MAGRKSGPRSEFEGTASEGGVIDGASGPLDPDAASGTGTASGDSGGTGGGTGSGGTARDSRGTEFDARIHSGPDQFNNDGTFAKRRGRKRGSNSGGFGGSGSRAKASNLKDAVEGLTRTLVVLHVGIAAVSKTPELAIDEDEGRMLAAATANVMEEFDLKPDPKTQAIVGLVIAAGTVYGPRMVAIQMRRLQERRETTADVNGTGTAGVYDGEGNPVGTTEFTTHRPN
jgi:hypothetical protein